MDAIDELTESLEKLIDDYGLLGVMLAAAEICRLKAAHVRTNWQDKELAKRWIRAAKKLEGMQAALVATGSVVKPKPAEPPADEIDASQV
jgi:hypothetical protein